MAISYPDVTEMFTFIFLSSGAQNFLTSVFNILAITFTFIIVYHNNAVRITHNLVSQMRKWGTERLKILPKTTKGWIWKPGLKLG